MNLLRTPNPNSMPIRIAKPSGSVSSTTSPIKVGVLHSLTGTMSISEVSVKDATLLAIEEINAAGGVLGHPLEPVVEDGASDLQTFAQKAKQLLQEERVSVVFGCWTSASRKAVLPIFEELNGLLFYPLQYEGLEQSPNIFYTGAAPNQQIVPAVDYLLCEGKRKIYLLGSDYIFPRTANQIIKAQLVARGGELVGEEYIPLGSNEVRTAIAHIQAVQPDAIVSTLNGDINVVFFQKLREAGLTSDRLPVMSVSVAEEEIRAIEAKNIAGHLVVWNYFQTLDTPENQKFVTAYKAKYGPDRVTDDPIEAAYVGVYLWKQAVEKAGSTQVAKVKAAAQNITFAAPQGLVKIDPKTQHLWKTVRIGKVRPDGSIEEIWNSDRPIPPDPLLKTYPWAAGLSQSGFRRGISASLMGLFVTLMAISWMAVGVGWFSANQIQSDMAALVATFHASSLGNEQMLQWGQESLVAANRSQWLLTIPLILSLLSMPIAFLLVSRITRALARVTQTAKLLASGDLTARAPLGCGDEIGVLSATLNTMALQVSALLKGLEVRSRQLEEHSRQLEAAAYAAEAANRAKSTFLANMSHELRTPLNAIIGYSELLQEEAQEQLSNEEFIDDLKSINVAGKHLLSLIGDILDISKIEAGKMDMCLETFEVETLVDDVVATIEPLVEKNGNHLVVHCSPDIATMHADLTKVRQALLNLLSNAAKFTDRGQITLEVTTILEFHPGASVGESAKLLQSCLCDCGSSIVFRVTDTGIGMSAEQISRLFQAFMQADTSTTRKYGGTGLGLAISQKFCQMMGGEITVESEVGGGSTFAICLPLEVSDRKEQMTSAPPERVSSESSPRRSLYEEDERSASTPRASLK